MSDLREDGANDLPDLRTQPGPHVFVDDLERLELDDDDRHHLGRVLRLRAGDSLSVSNGSGSWRSARFGDSLEPTGAVVTPPPPSYRISLGIALTKASKPEFVVQKATELGVDTLVVFHATHSVARWDSQKVDKNTVRLRRVAREAAMQSRQLYIPSVEFAADLAALAEIQPVARADFGGITPNSGHRCIAIGPEGGWSEQEVSLIKDAVDLGPSVLRAETAAIVAAAALARSRYLPR